MPSVRSTGANLVGNSAVNFFFDDWSTGAYVKLNVDSGGNAQLYSLGDGSSILGVCDGGDGSIIAYSDGGSTLFSLTPPSFREWLWVGITHIGGSTNMTVYWGSPNGPLHSQVLPVGSPGGHIYVYTDVFGEDADDAQMRSFFFRAGVLTAWEMLQAASTLSAPSGTNEAFLPLDDDATAGVNEGTGSDYIVRGTLTTETLGPPMGVKLRTFADTGAGDHDNCAVPSGTNTNDWLVAFVFYYDVPSAVVTPPSGWVSILRFVEDIGGGGFGTVSIGEILIHRYGYAADETATYTFSTGQYTNVVILALYNVDQVDPWAADTGNGAGTGIITGLQLTALRDQSMLLLQHVGYGTDAPSDPTGMTRVVTVDSVSDVWAQPVDAGTTGDRTAGNPGELWVANMGLLQPPNLSILPGAHTFKTVLPAAASLTTDPVDTQATGSTFVIYVNYTTITSAGPPTISDSFGNTYTQVGPSIDFASPGAPAAMFICENGVGGNEHTFTMTFVGTALCGLWVVEVVGGVLSGILDQTPDGAEDTTSPFISPTTGTTTQPNELVLSFVATGSTIVATETYTWSNGFTSLLDAGDTQTVTGSVGYLATSSTGTFQSSLDAQNGGSSTALCFISTFKAGGGAPHFDVQVGYRLVTFEN